MSAAEDLVAAGEQAPTVPRDRYGRPLVLPREGRGKPVAYTRVTTLASTLEDRYHLGLWYQRMTALGLVDRPDLMVLAAARRDDKSALNGVVADAVEAAAASAGANTGTALHRLCERLDKGEDVGVVPGDFGRDLAAYREALAPAVREVERFVVLDDLQVGGTFDRIVEWGGRKYIADIKTGSIEYGAPTMAIQLACYAHGEYYDPATGERSPLPDVSRDVGMIIHLPAGQGQVSLYWIDIAAGWESVPTALTVRQWRARRNLLTPVNDAAALATLVDVGLIADPILSQIAAADTADALAAIWKANKHAWTPAHTSAAAARKALLPTREGARA